MWFLSWFVRSSYLFRLLSCSMSVCFFRDSPSFWLLTMSFVLLLSRSLFDLVFPFFLTLSPPLVFLRDLGFLGSFLPGISMYILQFIRNLSTDTIFETQNFFPRTIKERFDTSKCNLLKFCQNRMKPLRKCQGLFV